MALFRFHCEPKTLALDKDYMHIRYRQETTARTVTRELVINTEWPLLFFFWLIAVWIIVQATRLICPNSAVKDEVTFVIH